MTKKFTLKIYVEGDCSKCSQAASVCLPYQVNLLDLKQTLVSKHDAIEREMKNLLCDECFMKTKFNLPDTLIIELTSSSSSDLD